MGDGGKKPWALLEFSAEKSTLLGVTGGKAFSGSVQDLGEMEGTQSCRQRKAWVGGVDQGWRESETMTDHSGEHRGSGKEAGGKSGR